jgi:hypothetical protein
MAEENMKKLFALTIIVMLAWSTGEIQAGPEKPVAPVKAPQLKVGASWSTTTTFKGGERACAIVWGVDEGAYFGLYVYDAKGNCVVRMDQPDVKFLKAQAVIWYPKNTQSYTIEVRNLGNIADSFYIDLRR